MAIIKVPKTPKRAFNKDRPASDLQQSQIAQLEWAIRPASQRSPEKMRRLKPPRTEGEAAERIASLTTQLHPEGVKTAPSAEMPPAGEPQAHYQKPRTKKPRRRARRSRTGK
jgi:hypothetical protein